MFSAGIDFEINEEHGIVRCMAKTPEALSAFKALQIQLVRIVPHLPEAPAVEMSTDGVIGPSTTLAVQMIASRLAEGAHPELAKLAFVEPEAAIPAVAQGAMELSGYLDSVLQQDPTAIAHPMPAEQPQVSISAILRSIFTKQRIAAASVAVVSLGGLALVARASSRRTLGRVDRSVFLPPSDGSDEFDEDEYEDDDGEYIDTTGVEVDEPSIEDQASP